MQLVANNTGKELAIKKPDVHVYDMIMGGGKTSGIAHSMRKWWESYKYDQIVYLAPNLSEVGGYDKSNDIEHSGRIREACPDIDFKNPKSSWMAGKTDDARDLVRNGFNIAATHQLFRNIMPEDLELISRRKALLVIDEALEVVSQYDDVSRGDLDILLDGGYIALDQNRKASWVKNVSTSKYDEVKELCDSGHLYVTPSRQAMIWEFPPEVLNAFDDVIISTYLFEGSLMAAWLDYNDYAFRYVNATNPENRPKLELADKERIKELLTIVESKSANAVGEGAMSYSWWDRSTKLQREKIKKATVNVVNNVLKGTKSGDILITCPKKIWNGGGIRGKGYARSKWLASNTRATNDYADKTVVLYLLDKHLNPMVSQYIKHRGGNIDDDAYALGEMLQFLWRGCIRKDQPMTVYIPSKRMRTLLMDWLGIPKSEQY